MPQVIFSLTSRRSGLTFVLGTSEVTLIFLAFVRRGILEGSGMVQVADQAERLSVGDAAFAPSGSSIQFAIQGRSGWW
jgi:hypothetical protein